MWEGEEEMGLTKKEIKDMEKFLIAQVKETVKNGASHVSYDKSFKFELKVKYNKKQNKTTVSQGFSN